MCPREAYYTTAVAFWGLHCSTDTSKLLSCYLSWHCWPHRISVTIAVACNLLYMRLCNVHYLPAINTTVSSCFSSTSYLTVNRGKSLGLARRACQYLSVGGLTFCEGSRCSCLSRKRTCFPHARLTRWHPERRLQWESKERVPGLAA